MTRPTRHQLSARTRSWARTRDDDPAQPTSPPRAVPLRVLGAMTDDELGRAVDELHSELAARHAGWDGGELTGEEARAIVNAQPGKVRMAFAIEMRRIVTSMAGDIEAKKAT